MVGEYDSHYRAYSLDEIYFDLTAEVRKRRTEGNTSDEEELASQVLQEIRDKVKAATLGLTCSAGIANNFMLAKICADIKKPDGQYLLSRERSRIMRFLADLPCRKVPGIGKVQEKILAGFNVRTMGDLLHNLHRVYFVSTNANKQFLLRASLGIEECEGDRAPEQPPEGVVTRKSLGVSRTFAPIEDPEEMRAKLREICDMVAADMEAEHLWGQLVTLKLKTSAFECLSKCSATAKFIHSAEEIYPIAVGLLDSFLPIKVRLLGVTISKFKNAFDNKRKDQPTLLEFLSPSKQTETAIDERRMEFQSESRMNPIEVIDLIEEQEELDLNSPSSSKNFVCPVCSKNLALTALDLINAHLDFCLGITSTKVEKSSTGGKRMSISSGSGPILKFLKRD